MLRQLRTNNDNQGFRLGFLANAIWGFSILIGILLFTIFVSCEDNTIRTEPAPGFIGGTVTDSLTGQPIFHAWVGHDSIYNSLAVLTDSNGAYILNAGFPGINRMAYCGKTDFALQAKIYSVISRDTTIINFQLVPEK
jgi:hypothetical protein